MKERKCTGGSEKQEILYNEDPQKRYTQRVTYNAASADINHKIKIINPTHFLPDLDLALPRRLLKTLRSARDPANGQESLVKSH